MSKTIHNYTYKSNQCCFAGAATRHSKFLEDCYIPSATHIHNKEKKKQQNKRQITRISYTCFVKQNSYVHVQPKCHIIVSSFTISQTQKILQIKPTKKKKKKMPMPNQCKKTKQNKTKQNLIE